MLGLSLILLGMFISLLQPITRFTGFAVSGNVFYAIGSGIYAIGIAMILIGIFLIAFLKYENLEGIAVSPSDIRSSRQGVPAGTFYAPDFYVTRDTNHNGMGYHCNLIRTKDDKRTSIRICYDGSRIYVEQHGSGVPVNLDRVVRFIEKNLVEDITKLLGRFKLEELAKPTAKARVIVPKGR